MANDRARDWARRPMVAPRAPRHHRAMLAFRPRAVLHDGDADRPGEAAGGRRLRALTSELSAAYLDA